MLILGMNSGHDGAVTAIEDGQLLWSLEAEKDSNWRYSSLTSSVFMDALQLLGRVPDVLALGGWSKSRALQHGIIGAGYQGWQFSTTRTELLGSSAVIFNSTHERSHVFGAMGMAPSGLRFPALCLVWEGKIGSFYHFHSGSGAPEVVPVLSAPGDRYAALFTIADERVGDNDTQERLASSGKMMALAAYGKPERISDSTRRIIETLLAPETVTPILKADFRESDLYNCGVTSQTFKNAAANISERIFETFMGTAHRQFQKNLPLFIGGGCALNCEWNSRFRESGYFSEVFVPPCPNDSGSSLGTALDAQLHLTGSLDLDWSVYCGGAFVDNADPTRHGWRVIGGYEALVEPLMTGCAVAWVEGRWEIGPRALGGRSLLAAAHLPSSREMLNSIKQRESYRPVAPVCREEDVSRVFVNGFADPYMLYFQQVRDPTAIPATTHVDGSARVQTVSAQIKPNLHSLLGGVAEQTGVGVLCNTSLNYPGLGFINSTLDLLDFCTAREIHRCYINGIAWELAAKGNGYVS